MLALLIKSFALGIEDAMFPRYVQGDHQATPVVEPDLAFRSFEEFLAYDDVKPEEQFGLFQDNPEIIAWLDHVVGERTRLCNEVWADEKMRRKLLRYGLPDITGKQSLDDWVEKMGWDVDGYWVDGDEPGERFWVRFEDDEYEW